MLKSQIRKEIRGKLYQQTDAQRLRKSNLIQKKLFNLAEFKRAGCVMFYIAKDEEVQTRSMIEQALKIGKKVAVPVVLKEEKRMVASLVEDLEKELTDGPYNILQPRAELIREVPQGSIDLAVVPGLAFDQAGRRLGRGAGFYDKFLAALSRKTPRIGLAFDFQVLKNIPSLPHDIAVDRVVSA